MGNLIQKMKVYYDLGINNVLTVALYRLLLNSRVLKISMPAATGYPSRLFDVAPQGTTPSFVHDRSALIARAENLLRGRHRYFCCHDLDVGSPPDWFRNPFNDKKMTSVDRHWTQILDFSSGVGDIKTLWEISRFHWVVDLALAFRVTGDTRYPETINAWTSSWTLQNPLNVGPNWKCGQEASLRMLQVLLAAYVTGQHHSPSSDLSRFVREHCQRIEPTIYYALAQNNNHGTSEAAALFVGGTWLLNTDRKGHFKHLATRWQRKGRKWLEDRVRKLIQDDGTFSQYSVIYHRLLVETLSLVEFWRNELQASRFSEHFYQKAGAAVSWLVAVTDADSGDAPNLGANDGTQLLRLGACDYRDFRPCVQLGSALFLGTRPYPDGPWDEPLNWLGLGVDLPVNTIPKAPVQQFKDGGYVVFTPRANASVHSWGLLCYPNYRFRPGHADGMHFDLWRKGVNLLRDSGSYSYNTDEPWQSYFSATGAHNTIQLDNRDQMTKISRFLRGSWLNMISVDECRDQADTLSWSGTYRDYAGGQHTRRIECSDDTWRVTDHVTGVRRLAVLRWRLAPGEWHLEEHRCIGEMAELAIEASVPIRRSAIVEGWESRCYWQKSKLPVWEIEFDRTPATLTTVIKVK